MHIMLKYVIHFQSTPKTVLQCKNTSKIKKKGDYIRHTIKLTDRYA